MKFIQQIFFFTHLIVCSFFLDSIIVSAESLSPTIATDAKSKLISVIPPEGFIFQAGTSPNILGILAPETGGFPEMNIVRTRIYPSNADKTHWDKIVINDYQSLGFKDISVKEFFNIEINTTSGIKYTAPAVLITYSRGAGKITSLVSWVQLKDFDVVLTTKHLTDNLKNTQKEWGTLTERITIDSDQLKSDPIQENNLSFPLAIYVAALLVLIFIYRKYRTN